jgi:hypothetical protein
MEPHYQLPQNPTTTLLTGEEGPGPTTLLTGEESLSYSTADVDGASPFGAF